MSSSRSIVIPLVFVLSLAAFAPALAAGDSAKETPPPTKVYVPYEKLKGVFENADQGVFLPYKEFQKLWRAALDKPAGVEEAPFEYLLSTARFAGEVAEELATIRLELTIDVLADDWVQIPIGLGAVAVAKAELVETPGRGPANSAAR